MLPSGWAGRQRRQAGGRRASGGSSAEGDRQRGAGAAKGRAARVGRVQGRDAEGCVAGVVECSSRRGRRPVRQAAPCSSTSTRCAETAGCGRESVGRLHARAAVQNSATRRPVAMGSPTARGCRRGGRGRGRDRGRCRGRRRRRGDGWAERCAATAPFAAGVELSPRSIALAI